MNKISIRKVNKKDIPEIVRIHRRCVSITNSKSYPKENINEWLQQINARNTECQLGNSLWYLIKNNKDIIGFCQFDIKDKELYQLQIDPKYQGKGYGKMLYAFIEEYFRKYKVSEISLYSSIDALDFYKKLGFTVTKPIKLKLKTVYNDLFEMKKKLEF